MQPCVEPPAWARVLEDGWIEMDERHYGWGLLRVFVELTDNIGRESPRVRVWGTTEEGARDQLAGQDPLCGGFVSILEPDAYCLIDPPPGLEEWTRGRTARVPAD